MDVEMNKSRLRVLEKIAEYEKAGKFELDVEDDPPTRTLREHEVDFTKTKTVSRIKTAFANFVARSFFDNQIRKNKLIIEKVEGMENYRAVCGGAIITCNHFNAFDNYAVYKVIQKDLGRRDLYKIIREGNYTTFKGLYGYFFRNCNTLPISSNRKVLAELMRGVSELLARGERILIYPEQGMWWNYRKPRPLKEGAFVFAARNNVPVIPFFISMRDSDFMGEDGFPVQAYTVHIMPAIYPLAEKNAHENTAYMMNENYRLLKEKYEEVYKTPLVYS